LAACGLFAPIIYTVHVCDRCQRQAEVGTVGGACEFEGCDGTLTQLEVVPLSAAAGWRRHRAMSEGKVERLNAELAGTLLGERD
jgi:hypothetical protein